MSKKRFCCLRTRLLGSSMYKSADSHECLRHVNSLPTFPKRNMSHFCNFTSLFTDSWNQVSFALVTADTDGRQRVGCLLINPRSRYRRNIKPSLQSHHPHLLQAFLLLFPGKSFVVEPTTVHLAPIMPASKNGFKVPYAN